MINRRLGDGNNVNARVRSRMEQAKLIDENIILAEDLVRERGTVETLRRFYSRADRSEKQLQTHLLSVEAELRNLRKKNVAITAEKNKAISRAEACETELYLFRKTSKIQQEDLRKFHDAEMSELYLKINTLQRRVEQLEQFLSRETSAKEKLNKSYLDQSKELLKAHELLLKEKEPEVPPCPPKICPSKKDRMSIFFPTSQVPSQRVNPKP